MPTMFVFAFSVSHRVESLLLMAGLTAATARRLGLAGVISGSFFLVFLWAFLLRPGRKRLLWLPVICTAFIEASWVMLAVTTSSHQLEYDAYRWMNGRSRPGEKIFAAWK